VNISKTVADTAKVTTNDYFFYICFIVFVCTSSTIYNNNNNNSFPLGSSGGPDGLTPQHIIDLLSGATDDSFQQVLVDFVNLLLAGSIDKGVSAIVFGGRLIALSKKDGGVRPFTTVGCKVC